MKYVKIKENFVNLQNNNRASRKCSGNSGVSEWLIIMCMMKKITIILVALLTMTGVLKSSAEFKIGPRIGLNVNKLHFNEAAMLEGSNRCGFTGGVQAEYLIPIINFGFDISLMYSYMDFKADVEGVTSNGTLDPDFAKHFLEIPLNLKYKISIPAISNIFAPYVFTGPAVAFKLGSDGGSFKSKTAQWTWNLGIGLEFIRHLQIGASYGWGMNNLMKKVDVWSGGLGSYTPAKLKMRNNYWTVTAAWLF